MSESALIQTITDLRTEIRSLQQQVATLTKERDHERVQRLQNLHHAVALKAQVATVTEALEKIKALPRYSEHEIMERPSPYEYINADDVDDLLAALAAVRVEQ